MNKKFFLRCVPMLWLAVSCTHVYKEYDKKSFPEYAWREGQEIIFNPTIEDTGKPYTLTLGMRHVYGFPVSSMHVTVKSIAPSGKEASKDYIFDIKNPEGKYISNCAGDLCDLEATVDENVIFQEPGSYKYIVTHNVPVDRLNGILEVGLILDEKD